MERIRDNVMTVTGGASGLDRAAALLPAANGGRLEWWTAMKSGTRATAEQIGGKHARSPAARGVDGSLTIQ